MTRASASDQEAGGNVDNEMAASSLEEQPTMALNTPTAQPRSSCAASISEVSPRLFVGNMFSTLRLEVLRENGISAIVSLMECRHGKWGTPSFRSVVPEADHLYIPCLDSSTTNLLPFMAQVCDFIERRLSGDAVSQRGVLLHCREGVSRSASMAVAYLMRKNRWSLDRALARVKEKRRVRPNKNFLDQLRVWGAVGYGIWLDVDMAVPKPDYQDFLDRRAGVLLSKGLTGDEPIGIQSL